MYRTKFSPVNYAILQQITEILVRLQVVSSSTVTEHLGYQDV